MDDKTKDRIDLNLTLDFEQTKVPLPKYILERSKVEFITTIQNRKDKFNLSTSGEVGTCVNSSNC
jgi:hypothetical protein